MPYYTLGILVFSGLLLPNKMKYLEDQLLYFLSELENF